MNDAPEAPVVTRSAARTWLLRLAWTAGVGLVVLLFLRTFVCGVYRVDSDSMAPFLRGSEARGELVLVSYTKAPDRARFDPLVILRPGQTDPVVKRLVGLPREDFQIVGGDLLIGGQRLGLEVPRPEPVPVFDQDLLPLEESFRLTGEAWELRGGVLSVDASLGAAGGSPARASFHAELVDSQLRPSGEVTPGERQVGDAILELELNPGASPGRLRIRLTEEGDRFDLELELGDSGGVGLALVRRRLGAPDEVLDRADVDLRAGTWRRLRFLNLDNSLRVDLDDGVGLLGASYEHNTPLTGVPDPTYRHLRPRVEIEVSGAEPSLRRLRILRDLHYTQRGTFGVRRALRLGPDELFFLGDNSPASLDSRDFGPVPLDQVIGRPVAAIWPPSAWRLLRRPRR